MRVILTSITFLISFITRAQPVDTLKIKEVEIFDRKKSQNLELITNQNFNQTLKTQSFTFVKDYGPGLISTITLRGLGANHTSILWDGVSINNPMLGQTDVSLLPNFLLEQAEQLESNNLFINTNGNFGGGFNLKNKKPEGLSFSISANYSTIKNNNYGLRFANKHKHLYYQTAINIVDAANQYHFFNPLTNEIQTQVHAQQKLLGFNYTLGYEINKLNNLEYKGWIQKSNRQLPSPIGVNNNTESQLDFFNRHQIKYQATFYKLHISNTIAVLGDSINYFNPKANGEASVSRSYSQSIKNNFNANYFFNNKLYVKNGLQIDQSSGHIKRYTNNKARLSQAHGFVNPNVVLKNLEINSLFKLSYFSLANKYYPTYNINANYSLTSYLKASANFGQNIRFPTLNDLFWEPNGNKDLQPEKGNLKDVSLIISPLNEKIGVLKVTAYYNTIINYIQWLPNATTGYFTPVNLNKVNLRGFEISATNEFNLKNIHFKNQLFYAYTISKPTPALGGFYAPSAKQLLYTPIYNLKNNFSVAQRTCGEINLSYQLVSWRATSTDNYEYLPWYQLMDATYRKELNFKKNRITISVTAYNLLNTDYMVIANRPMPKRYFTFSLQYVFKK